MDYRKKELEFFRREGDKRIMVSKSEKVKVRIGCINNNN